MNDPLRIRPRVISFFCRNIGLPHARGGVSSDRCLSLPTPKYRRYRLSRSNQGDQSTITRLKPAVGIEQRDHVIVQPLLHSCPPQSNDGPVAHVGRDDERDPPRADGWMSLVCLLWLSIEHRLLRSVVAPTRVRHSWGPTQYRTPTPRARAKRINALSVRLQSVCRLSIADASSGCPGSCCRPATVGSGAILRRKRRTFGIRRSRVPCSHLGRSRTPRVTRRCDRVPGRPRSRERGRTGSR
ncbi:hypothetical protein SAMN05421752_10749 [Natronorubrum thiooxidans]|uniref:Uncharacterized protein n=1 Tax=Natronorubrum thiooxidans TaxID=308853 RepID=A0A1N7FJX9_9EURY|nr:hypothetical protein SAMN05421752_10749 [Natronorubrum thiooxidans]